MVRCVLAAACCLLAYVQWTVEQHICDFTADGEATHGIGDEIVSIPQGPFAEEVQWPPDWQLEQEKWPEL